MQYNGRVSLIIMSKEREKEGEKKPQIYIGHLPSRIKEREIEDHFSKFGKHKPIILKERFAFLVILSNI